MMPTDEEFQELMGCGRETKRAPRRNRRRV